MNGRPQRPTEVRIYPAGELRHPRPSGSPPSHWPRRSLSIVSRQPQLMQTVRTVARGCEKLFQERVSPLAQRAQLEAAPDWAREGDTFAATTMDRVARSSQHLLEIVEGLDRKGVALRLLDF